MHAYTIRLPIIGTVAMIVMLSVGCATERVVFNDKPVLETRLFVTRSGGDVTLAWDSEPGLAYSIFYNHTQSAKSPWKILPGYDRIRGTGRRISYTDKIPVNATRYYRLHAYPAIGYDN